MHAEFTPENPAHRVPRADCRARWRASAQSNLTMVALDSYGGLTEFGLFVRPELADMLDGLPQADLEERYLKHRAGKPHWII